MPWFEDRGINRTHHSRALSLFCLLGLLLFGFNAAAVPMEVRSIDGYGNNPDNPSWGQADTPLFRLLDPAYEDRISIPRGGDDPSSLPSARAISNAVATQKVSKPSAARINSWFWQWGQFIDHDIDLTGTHEPKEPFNITVPADDPHFPQSTAINLNRSIYDAECSCVRQQLNQISTYIDGSMIYGSDQALADSLRMNDGSGKLKTTTGVNGEILLPYDPSSPAFFISGDVRVNEQIGLTAAHTLFVREHNKLADELADRLSNPDLRNPNDIQLLELRAATPLSDADFIYEAVRKVVGAKIQKITYNEFLPMLLGDGALEEYMGYDDEVNPSISNAFSTAAYRVGHTMLPSELFRAHDLYSAIADNDKIKLKDAFFNPSEIEDKGVDSLLLGLLRQAAQEIDTLIIDGVRNFLFGDPRAGGFDLASLNIQRGRDHGIPGYNQAREEIFGMDGRVSSFLEMTGEEEGNSPLADLFALVYGTTMDGDNLVDNIDLVDLWIGGLAEEHYNGALVGETFYHIIKDQFTRLRDGDRFYFMGDEMQQLLLIDPLFMFNTSLSNIIDRNTSYTGMPSNAFQLVPTPGSLLLMLIGFLSLAANRTMKSSRQDKSTALRSAD